MAGSKLLAKAYAISLMGLAGTVIEVESEISSSLPGFVLVGLPDASLSESKDRVRAAIQNSGLKMPDRRVTVNLSPASVRKQGSSYDLAIAVSIMSAAGIFRAESSAQTHWVHLGELGLDGSVRSVTGILPALLVAKSAGITNAVVPEANLTEALLVSDMNIKGVRHLCEVAQMFGVSVAEVGGGADSAGDGVVAKPQAPQKRDFTSLDIADVLGQEDAIEALTVAAAGGHHLLMVGPPGAGKTMMAERLPTILPDLTLDDALQTTAVISISENRNFVGGTLMLRPPFEAPHHSASVSSLVGGGMGMPRPGLISLAHHGVLFLDEAPEFQKSVLEALRQPLESGEVVIHRSGGTARFPAKFQLVLAANPCPCGNAFGLAKTCRCSPQQLANYLSRLSGPLLDRVDIRLTVRPASSAQMAAARSSSSGGKTSVQIKAEVTEARSRALKRLAGTPWTTNAQVPGPYLRKKLALSEASVMHLEKALSMGRISMRGFDRCLRLAWTSADLAGRKVPDKFDVAKAMHLRGPESLLDTAAEFRNA